jgi:hypothetical protein
LGATPPDPLRASAHPELSSIGRINDYLEAEFKEKAATIEVEDWWIAFEVINRLLLTNLWTWNGEMCLSVSLLAGITHFMMRALWASFCRSGRGLS